MQMKILTVDGILERRGLTSQEAERAEIIDELRQKEPQAEDLLFLALRNRLHQDSEEHWDPFALLVERGCNPVELSLQHLNVLRRTAPTTRSGKGGTATEAMETAFAAVPADMDWDLTGAAISGAEHDVSCVLRLTPYYSGNLLANLRSYAIGDAEHGWSASGRKLLQLAASHGDLISIELMLLLAEKQGDSSAAAEWNRKLLDQGGTDALVSLGRCMLLKDYGEDGGPDGSALAARAKELGFFHSDIVTNETDPLLELDRCEQLLKHGCEDIHAVMEEPEPQLAIKLLEQAAALGDKNAVYTLSRVCPDERRSPREKDVVAQ